MNRKTKVTQQTQTTKVSVSELNLRKSAARLLGAKLVSVEVAYVQHVLGSSATQEAIDTQVLAVRAMPWANIVIPE